LARAIVERIPETFVAQRAPIGNQNRLQHVDQFQPPRLGVPAEAIEGDTSEEVADRLRGALQIIAPDHLIAAPDCGAKYLTRDLAFAKLKALSDGVLMVRRELDGR